MWPLKEQPVSPVIQVHQLIIPSPGLCLRASSDGNGYAETVDARELAHVLLLT